MFTSCRSCRLRSKSSSAFRSARPAHTFFRAWGGIKPIQGVAKFFNTRLKAQIIANTGSAIPKKITSHTLRRTVATRIAEVLGDEGDKLIKRVLGHSDGSVTAIYNRYGYVREMRRALEAWAAELLSGLMWLYSAARRDLFHSLIWMPIATRRGQLTR